MTTAIATTFYLLERHGVLSAEWQLDHVAHQVRVHGGQLVEVFQAASHGDAHRYVDQRTRERDKRAKPTTKQGLKDRAEAAEADLAALRERVNELRAYVLSDKFRGEDALAGYVSVGDVLTRLQG